jgi:hypothetical protein
MEAGVGGEGILVGRGNVVDLEVYKRGKQIERNMGWDGWMRLTWLTDD